MGAWVPFPPTQWIFLKSSQSKQVPPPYRATPAKNEGPPLKNDPSLSIEKLIPCLIIDS